MSNEEDYTFKASATMFLGLTDDGQICRRIYLDPHPDDAPKDTPTPITHSLVLKAVQHLQVNLAADITDEEAANKILPKIHAIEQFEYEGWPWVRIEFNDTGEALVLPMENSDDAKE